MPVRKIKKSYRSVTGVMTSRKTSRMVASESTLERDLFILLEFDPAVEKFEEQPVRLTYPGDGKIRSYTKLRKYLRLSSGQPTVICQI